MTKDENLISHATRLRLNKSGIRPKELEDAVCLAVFGFKPYEGGRRVVQALKDLQESADGSPRFLVSGEIPNDEKSFYRVIVDNNEVLQSKMTREEAAAKSGASLTRTYEIEDLCTYFVNQSLGFIKPTEDYPRKISEKLGIQDDTITDRLRKEMNEAFDKHLALAKTRAGRG
jgi:hypothetical protein